MPTVNFSPIFNGWQGFTPSGVPLANGFIQTYQAGTSTPLATYTTNAGNVANANPIPLLADGRPPQEIWLDAAFSYKFVLLDVLANPIATYDNITGIDNTVPAALTEWVLYAPAPSYVNATTFTLAGNQTALFEIGRRVRYTLTGGQFTGSITNSVFGAVTTVTVATDSIPLDATLSAVAYGFLDALKPSVPTAFLSPVTAPSVSASSYLNISVGVAAPPSGLSYGAFRDSVNGLGISTVSDIAYWFNGSKKFQMTLDGRFYGTALHNNPGSMTGTANQYVGSGTYTPTSTAQTNVTTTAGVASNWIRDGNCISVGFGATATPTSAAACTIRIALPIPSNLTGGQLHGSATAQNGTVFTVAQVVADTINKTALITWTAPNTTAGTIDGVFQYEVN